MTEVDRPPLIMVATRRDLEIARSKGWTLLDIVLPDVRMMEGRRYRSIHITWEAMHELLTDAEGDVLMRLNSDQAAMGTTVTVGNIIEPPKE